MHPRGRWPTGIVPGVVALTLLGGFDAGATDPVVAVTFELRAAPVAALYSKEQRPAAEKLVAAELASASERTFRYWSFTVLDKPGYPLLQAWLTSNADGEYRIEGSLRRSAGAPVDPPWSIILFKPGDLDAYGAPAAERWPEVLKGKLQDFLDQNHGPLAGALQEKAPLGTSLHFVVPPPPDSIDKAQAVLALDWNRYSELATSNFVIWVQAPGGQARIHSTGLGLSAPFPGQPKYSAAVWVQFRTWEETGGPVDIKECLKKLGSAKPIAYYLESANTPGGVLIHGQ